MAVESKESVLLREFQTLFGLGAVQGLTDGQLLERFLTADEVTARAAFTNLVDRHGAMVLHACRGVLGDPHDAQDAFQATFLVFWRRAASIRKRESVASWLFGVALRVARRARYAAIVRRFHEREGGALAASRTAISSEISDHQTALHEEIARLPGRYREPVVLCHLEGLPTAVAAQRLGCAHGTILSRLARGRDRLRRRLTRRGLTDPTGLLAANLVPRGVTVALPNVSVCSTALVAARTEAGRVAVSPIVAALTQATLRSLFMTRLALVAAVLVTTAALAFVTAPFVSPIFGTSAPASFPGQDSNSAAEIPRPNVRVPVQTPDLEEAFYRLLKREHEFNDPRWPYLIKVRDVQGKTLIDCTLKHKAKGQDQDFDLVIQAKRAIFHFDREARVVRVFLEEPEVQHFAHSTDVDMFHNRVLEFPLPPDIRFTTEKSPPQLVVDWVRQLVSSRESRFMAEESRSQPSPRAVRDVL